MQLVVREGVFIVAIPCKLEGFLDRSCAIFVLLTSGIVLRATGWHGNHCLGAEGHDGSEAKGSGVHACLLLGNVLLMLRRSLLSILGLERKLQ